jgi:hypothetical protein
VVPLKGCLAWVPAKGDLWSKVRFNTCSDIIFPYILGVFSFSLEGVWATVQEAIVDTKRTVLHLLTVHFNTCSDIICL